jgi:branched-chain amino acid aminotransferase
MRYNGLLGVLQACAHWEAFMSELGTVFFRGGFRPLAEATVSIRSKALNYGLGCFEGIRAYWNAGRKQLFIFRCPEHFERMTRSVKILGMSPLPPIQKLCELSVELLRRNEVRCDAYLRPIAFVNSELLSPTIVQEDNEFAMYALPLNDYLDTANGVTARVSSWVRVSDNMIPVVAKPTAAYLNSALARLEAKQAGADEAIFLNKEGYVAEGSAEHIVLVRDGRLVTPSSEDDNLFGITRASLDELARNELGLDVVYRHVKRTDLYIAEEAFFCGTGAQVTPITRIDDRIIGEGRPGPITLKLQAVYAQAVRGENAKYSAWCMPVY